mmetsp:Transcript_22937/g.40641  ORF Transcript_22937/g.40641 Transcript_22937/m.40641 type:complete len:205 (+) Transcript_22937:1-615(+)
MMCSDMCYMVTSTHVRTHIRVRATQLWWSERRCACCGHAANANRYLRQLPCQWSIDPLVLIQGCLHIYFQLLQLLDYIGRWVARKGFFDVLRSLLHETTGKPRLCSQILRCIQSFCLCFLHLWIGIHHSLVRCAPKPQYDSQVLACRGLHSQALIATCAIHESSRLQRQQLLQNRESYIARCLLATEEFALPISIHRHDRFGQQ